MRNDKGEVLRALMLRCSPWIGQGASRPWTARGVLQSLRDRLTFFDLGNLTVSDAWPRLFGFLGMLLVLGSPVLGDEFERLEGEALGAIPKGSRVKAVTLLNQEELGRLPRVLAGIRSTVLVVKTGEGNLARVLVSIARRLPAEEGGKEAPVVIVERYATFAASGFRQRLARGRDVMLFDEFWLDLDSGQIVPEGFGGDLRVRVEGADSVALECGPGAMIYCLTEAPTVADEAGRPSPGRVIVADDYGGRFHLVADGRWSGLLELKVERSGQVGGSFRSDQTGSVYKVRGSIVGGGTARLECTIDFPRSQLRLLGRLWTDGKDAMAGTVSLLDRDYGFVAIREGRSLEPPGLDLDSKPSEVDSGAVLRLSSDGRLWNEKGVIEVAEVGVESGEVIRLVVAREVPFVVVERVVKGLRERGDFELRVEVESADEPKR